MPSGTLRRIFKALAVCAALLPPATTPAAASAVPLPDTIEYAQPAADVPENVRRVVGRWEGKWGTELNHVFIVTSVSAGCTQETAPTASPLPVPSDQQRYLQAIDRFAKEYREQPNDREKSSVRRAREAELAKILPDAGWDAFLRSQMPRPGAGG